MNDKIKEIFRFCMVGGISFLIDYGLLYFFTEYCHIKYLISSAISFSISVIINYILCLTIVFNKAKNGWNQMILFIFSSVIGLIINQICMYFFVEYMMIHYMISKILATIIVTIWNYITKKKSIEREI